MKARLWAWCWTRHFGMWHCFRQKVAWNFKSQWTGSIAYSVLVSLHSIAGPKLKKYQVIDGRRRLLL